MGSARQKYFVKVLFVFYYEQLADVLIENVTTNILGKLF